MQAIDGERRRVFPALLSDKEHWMLEWLAKEAPERTQLLQAIQGQTTKAKKVAAFLPDAVGRFKALLDDLSNVTQLQVDRARGLLRVLLGDAIILHPCADTQGRYFEAEVSGDYAGLLRLAVGHYKSGGGQGS